MDYEIGFPPGGPSEPSDFVNETKELVSSSGSYDEYIMKCAVTGTEPLLLRNEFDSFKSLYC